MNIINFSDWLTPEHAVLSGTCIFFAACLLDQLYRARKFPRERYWQLRGVASFIYFSAMLYFIPFLWDHWLAEHSLQNLSESLFLVQFTVGFLLYELGIYVWHRTMHHVDILWRFGHQLHHSAERVDVYGAYYFHPIDVLGFSLVGSLALIFGLGVSLEAAVLIGFVANNCALFQHMNIRTPVWLGYFIVRPEAHTLHHKRGRHYGNFGDIPLWDVLFGTYKNPVDEWKGEVGFFSGASLRLKDVLLGRDLHKMGVSTQSRKFSQE